MNRRLLQLRQALCIMTALRSLQSHLDIPGNLTLIQLSADSIQSGSDISAVAVHHYQVNVAGWQVQPCSKALLPVAAGAHFATFELDPWEAETVWQACQQAEPGLCRAIG